MTMKDPKTTIAGILTGVGTIIGCIVLYLKTGQMDIQTAITAVVGIATAAGLIKAADSTGV